VSCGIRRAINHTTALRGSRTWRKRH